MIADIKLWVDRRIARVVAMRVDRKMVAIRNRGTGVEVWVK